MLVFFYFHNRSLILSYKALPQVNQLLYFRYLIKGNGEFLDSKKALPLVSFLLHIAIYVELFITSYIKTIV